VCLLCVIQPSTSSSKNDAPPPFPPNHPPDLDHLLDHREALSFSSPLPCLSFNLGLFRHLLWPVCRFPISAAPADLESETPEERRARILSNARRLHREHAEELCRQQENGVVDLDCNRQHGDEQYGWKTRNRWEPDKLKHAWNNLLSPDSPEHRIWRCLSPKYWNPKSLPAEHSYPAGQSPEHWPEPYFFCSTPRLFTVQFWIHTEGIVRAATGNHVSTPFPSGPGYLSRQGTAIPPNFVPHH
jgi:hypothetical protein